MAKVPKRPAYRIETSDMPVIKFYSHQAAVSIFCRPLFFGIRQLIADFHIDLPAVKSDSSKNKCKCYNGQIRGQ